MMRFVSVNHTIDKLIFLRWTLPQPSVIGGFHLTELDLVMIC